MDCNASPRDGDDATSPLDSRSAVPARAQEQEPAGPAGRLPWQAPRLECYGPINAVTRNFQGNAPGDGRNNNS